MAWRATRLGRAAYRPGSDAEREEATRSAERFQPRPIHRRLLMPTPRASAWKYTDCMNRTISLPTLPMPSQRPGAGINYELFLDCVHCGLCTSACPTYVELGTEMDSPRGRIYLMRAVTDGRLDLTAEVERHLDLCLNCRACESACPSGVQYGKLIEPFRIHMQKTMPAARQLPFLQRLLLFQVTPYNWRTRWALAPARLLQWTGLDRLLDKSGLL